MSGPLPWHPHQWRNRIQSVLLIMLMLGISSLVGRMLLGVMGLWLAFVGALLVLSIEPAATWRITLRLYRARPISPYEAPELWFITKTLAERAQLPAIPLLYYIPSSMINAFAVGHRQHAAIALTDGLLTQLTLRELSGVLGHEIAHIAHDDLRVMGLADYISRLTNLFSMAGQFMLLLSLPVLFIESYDIHINLLSMLLLLFSPQLSVLAQLGLSRIREYDADQKSAMLTGDPLALAYALARIKRGSRSWVEILLPGWGNPQPSWLRSHPSTEERIERLQEYARSFAYVKSPMASDLPPGTIARAVLGPPRWRIGGYWY
ncbi:MAG: zinc metalloprotease HtpX [Methylomonas sp.]|nr:zinc metalloprotease HtpX [Methylomonas sp.]